MNLSNFIYNNEVKSIDLNNFFSHYIYCAARNLECN